MPSKPDRQQRILELIARNHVASQVELQDLLLAEGVAAAQSTLSRDLRELGVIRGPDGYRLLGAGTPRPHVLRELARSIRPLVEAWDAGGNLLVLRPVRADGARELADRVAGARAPEIVASLACDGRVLVVARTPAQARALARRLG